MGDSDPMKITVTTQFNEDLIQQATDMLDRRMQVGVIRLREQGVREALVKLGWTPPDGDAYLEGVKAGLEAAAQWADRERATYVKWVGQCAGHDERYMAADAIRGIDPASVTRKGGADGR